MARKKVPHDIEMQVLTRSRRRCCLCFWLERDEKRVIGQIAHLDQNPENNDFDNLAFLCLKHHDEYDGRTSVSKGLQRSEVRHYRDRLYKELDWDSNPPADQKSGSNESSIREPDAPEFMGYLDGLNGDELFRLASAVLIDHSQTIYSGQIDPVTSALKAKGFLKSVEVMQTLRQMKQRQPIPFTILPAAWRYLNDNKDWLMERAIERNPKHTERLTLLRDVRLE